MSRRNKKVGVTVRAVPLALAIVCSNAAGALVGHFNGTPEEILAAQTGVHRNLFEAVIVYGTEEHGIARDEISIAFDENDAGDIEIDLEGGQKSAINALDGSLARALTYQSERMRRRGLRPVVRYRFRQKILEDPQRLAAARQELGTEGTDEISWGGMNARPILKISPGKDKGMTLTLRRGFKSI